MTRRPKPSPARPRLFPTVGLLTLVALPLGPLGCPNDDVADGNETCGETGGEGLAPGDLVISEVAANLDGNDEAREWLEVYNATGETIDLAGLVLVYEGQSTKTHVVARSLEVPAGGYVVLGSVNDDLAGSGDWAHVDYGYGNDLGEFGNTSGYLAIECDQVIDEVSYAEGDIVETGSWTFDGSQPPDALANNQPDSWCTSRTEFTPIYAATPGAANDVCGSQGTCGDGIEIIPPVLGEIVITEVMANPMVASDTDAEWFEIHSLAAGEFHLNGLEIGKSLEDEAEDTIAAAECIVLAPGEYVIVAKTVDETLNGMLPPEAIVWETGISLTNSGGSLWVGVDGEVLDHVGWGSVGDGEAWQLDPGKLDPVLNDDPVSWCDAITPYGQGDLGTPGAANDACPLPPPPDGQCWDNGELRDIVPVENGDLEITEAMPNPEGDDGPAEWFEVLVKGPGDLNGLQLGKGGAVEETLLWPECEVVSAGERLVFAHELPENGGPPVVDYLFDFALLNSNGDLTVGYADEVYDQATWTTVMSGFSWSKDQNGEWCDAKVEDLYDGGNHGTPGDANPLCGGAPPDGCIDPDTMSMRMINSPSMGEITLSEVMPNPSTPEPGGEWFEVHAAVAMDLNGLQLGKSGGFVHTVNSEFCVEVAADGYAVLARTDDPNLNCDLPAVDYVYAGLALSNGAANNVEIGYDNVIWSSYQWDAATSNGVALSYDPMGMVWCEAVAPFGCGDLGTPGAPNPACGGGNNMDDMCLDGMMMRAIVTPNPGDLVISEFMANPAAVGDAAGEWFEIEALAAFDLNGLLLGQDYDAEGMGMAPKHTVSSAECLAFGPGDTALLARNADPMANGGLPAVDYVFSGFGLSNSNSGLYVASIVDNNAELLDGIAWTAVATGRSTSLDPDNLDPVGNDVANNSAPWCYSPADVMVQFGAGDYGTPGGVNLQCP